MIIDISDDEYKIIVNALLFTGSIDTAIDCDLIDDNKFVDLGIKLAKITNFKSDTVTYDSRFKAEDKYIINKVKSYIIDSSIKLIVKENTDEIK